MPALFLLVLSMAVQVDTLPAPPLRLLGEPVDAVSFELEGIHAGEMGDGPTPGAALPTSGRLLGVAASGELAPPTLSDARATASINRPTIVKSRPSFAILGATPMPPAEFPGTPAHVVELPTALGFVRSQLDRAIDSIEEEVRRGAFPGAAFAVGRWNQTVIERGIGTLDGRRGSPVDPDHTLYDLASLTKVIATTTAVMLLVEDGKMNIDAPVSFYLPRFRGGEKGWVTIRHLLTHSSGLPAGANISADSPEQALQRALDVPLVWRPGQRVEYSDIGFIVLWAAAEAANGAPLEEMLQERVFEPLGMWSTGFLPGESCVRCAPTLDRPGYRGIVHDPTARRLGGIAGNAGLFSTVHDLARFAGMLAGGGELHGVRVLQPSTLALFTQRQPGLETRALGWDTPDPRGEGSGGLQISPNAFGHTGFTGTSLWVDPERDTWVIFLSNRTYDPRGRNRIQELRRELNNRVATSIDIAR